MFQMFAASCNRRRTHTGQGMLSSITTPTQVGLGLILWGTNTFIWFSRDQRAFDLSFACVLGATISLVMMIVFLVTSFEHLGFIRKKPSQQAISEFQKKLQEVELAKQAALTQRNRTSTLAASNSLLQAGVDVSSRDRVTNSR